MFASSLNSVFSSPQGGLQAYNRHRVQESRVEPSDGNKREARMSPQKIIDLKVVDTLEKRLNIDGMSLKSLRPEDFSPQAVSERILSAVRQAYGQFRQTRPESDNAEFFAQVREGLEQGFAEARDILQNLGVLQGQIADDVDVTHDLTLQGLEQLESGLGNIATDMAFQSIFMQSSRSAQLQIETQQGDLVTIAFNQSSSTNRSSLQASRLGHTLNAYQESVKFNSELNITIEGDLNEDEQNALRQVMQNMHRISNAFFHGDMQAAFKHAMKAGFDSEQIAGFSLDLSEQKSVQAVAAYRQTAQPEHTIDSDLLTRAGGFLEAAKTLLLADAQSGLQKLLEPRQVFDDLFNEIGRLSRENRFGPDAVAESQLFADIIAALGKNVFDDKTEQGQAA